jgi:hypothetical protein
MLRLPQNWAESPDLAARRLAYFSPVSAARSSSIRRAAAIYALIETANLNDIDPQAWLADVLPRLPDHPANRIDRLLP